MKSINSNTLLDLLQNDVRAILLQANKWKTLPTAILQQQPAKDKWSIAQVTAHLNFYCRFYIDAIENKLHLNESKASEVFKPGWLGNYFTKLMLPKADNTVSKKMKAPTNALPPQAPDAIAAIQEFINHQHQLLNLLTIAKKSDLSKIKIPTSLSSFIRLKLGDTFRFVIAHEQRHCVQIKNILELNSLPVDAENSH